jgi:hypothetical protein
MIDNDIDSDGVSYFGEALETNKVKYTVYLFHTYFTAVDHRRLQA